MTDFRELGARMADELNHYQQLLKDDRRDELRALRRPQPPSLKEQALDELDRIQTHDESGQEIVNLSVIRRALESLPD